MADVATLDPSAIAQIAKDAATAALKEADSAREAKEAQAAQAAAQASRNEDPLRQVLLKELGPDIARATLMAADAQDAARFYSGNPEAGKYREQVEAKSSELMARGEPMDRQSIFYYIRGKDFDKFRTDANEAERQQQARANSAAIVIGGEAVGLRPTMELPSDPWSMSADELEKHMAGKVI